MLTDRLGESNKTLETLEKRRAGHPDQILLASLYITCLRTVGSYFRS